ncbi:MAG: TonB-dependent receptor [Candidatus Adiutrix sp.]|jgi:iron complex outermembrane receptor protein|nr:TonB-dependent receptor [Candidatus Adiutrix sp.]
MGKMQTDASQTGYVWKWVSRPLAVTLAAALCWMEPVVVQKAFAQEDETGTEVTDSSVADADGGEYQLPTILVTADKRETDLQKTPTAVTVFTGQKLEDANMDSIQKVLQHVPNMNLSPFLGGVTLMSFRGATTSPGTSTSPLVMYLDGVPLDTYFNLDAPLMDIERVEVLRGPQSAVYGKNAMGGVINVISRKPDNDWRGSLQAGYSSFATQKYSAMFSGPLVEDKLYFSLGAMHYNTDGYMNNAYTSDGNKERTERFKTQLRYTPTSDTEFNLHLNYTAKRDGYSSLVVGDRATLNSYVNPDDNLNSNVWNLALHGTVNFEPAVFETITTYRTEDLDYAMDMGLIYTDQGMIADYVDTGRDNKRSEFTQEFRLKSPDSETGVRWMTGIYGGYTDMDIRSVYTDAYLPDYFMGMYDTIMKMDQPSREYTYDYAAFGEVTVPVTDIFRVTAALRGQYTRKKISLSYDSLTEIPGLGMSIPDYMSARHSDHWFELLPKLNLSLDVTDEVMLYAGVNRSFIPGGFNNVSTTGVDMTYEAQTAWNYEAGAKTEWFDKRFLFNTALFYTNFENLQVFQYDVATAQYLSSNAGAARSYGIEVDAVARLLPGLDAEFSYGYTNAKFRDYKHMGQDHSNNNVPYTPKHTTTFALQYQHDQGFFARGEVVNYGSLYWDEANEKKRDGLTLLNARIGYEHESGLGVYLYGNNLTDKKYLYYYTAASNVGMMARPREIGIQLQYNF